MLFELWYDMLRYDSHVPGICVVYDTLLIDAVRPGFWHGLQPRQLFDFDLV